MAKICGACGAQMDDGTKFCTNCGAKMDNQASQETAPPAASAPPAPPVRQGGINMGQGHAAQGASHPNPAAQQGSFRPGGAMPMNGGYPVGEYVPDKGIKEMFFRSDGRLNRMRYFLRSMVLGIIMLVIDFVAYLIDPDFGAIVMSFLPLAFMPSSVMLNIRRLHDLNYSGWFAIIAFIPIINLAIGLMLTFIPGTPGPNKYGADPLG